MVWAVWRRPCAMWGRLAGATVKVASPPGRKGTSVARPPRRDPPKRHGDRATATAARATGKGMGATAARADGDRRTQHTRGERLHAAGYGPAAGSAAGGAAACDTLRACDQPRQWRGERHSAARQPRCGQRSRRRSCVWRAKRSGRTDRQTLEPGQDPHPTTSSRSGRSMWHAGDVTDSHARDEACGTRGV